MGLMMLGRLKYKQHSH